MEPERRNGEEPLSVVTDAAAGDPGTRDREGVEEEPEETRFSKYLLPAGLFLLTLFTTLWAGAYQNHPDLFHPFLGAWTLLTERPRELINGVPFAFTLLLILVTHELAHYVCSKMHRVPASLPLFIPGLPILVGTFGAIIRVRGPILERKALFDIGIWGPLAGFLVAIVALVVGLRWSHVDVGLTDSPFLIGRSLLLDLVVSLVMGELPAGASVNLHPIAEAAWFGLFVTCLNLIPIGQLDGGHVAYAMWGERQRTLAYAALPVLFLLGYFGWHGWLVWVGMAGLLGFSHPTIPRPESTLGAARTWLGRATVVLFVLIFPPFPIMSR
jgi:membrane-associated protease RseP (regulator of RpoE activity)